MELDTNNTKGGLESYMKKVVSILLSIIMVISLSPVIKADEIDVPVDDPVIPEYQVRYVPGGTGSTFTLYVTNAAIRVRPRVTAGTIRVYDSGSISAETVQVCADIMGFDSNVYTINQIHANPVNISFYRSGASIYAKFKIQVWAGSISNSTTSDYVTILIF